MIAAAIGRPTAKATAIVDVIAKSKSSSGCTLSSLDMAYSNKRKPKAGAGTSGNGILAHCVEAPGKWCSRMVNKTLIAGHGLTSNGAKSMKIHRPRSSCNDQEGRRRLMP
jgi:hypothetical protein